MDAKRQSTLSTEGLAINYWNEHLGRIRLDRITRSMVDSYIAKRQVAGFTGRTVNLEVICFRNVRKRNQGAKTWFGRESTLKILLRMLHRLSPSRESIPDDWLDHPAGNPFAANLGTGQEPAEAAPDRRMCQLGRGHCLGAGHPAQERLVPPRHQTAEEMMLALLAFQFDKAALRRRKNTDVLTIVIGILGVIAALGVVGGLIWRFIRLLNHEP